MKDIKSKFIIEVFYPEYFNKPTYIQKLGNQPWSITFTNDIYKAKMFDKKNTAELSAGRAIGHVEEAYRRGYTSYGYNYNSEFGTFDSVMKSIGTNIIEVKLNII